MQRISATKKMYIPFHKLYTPPIIVSTAEFTSGYYNYSKTALVFGTGLSNYRLFKILLIPAGIIPTDPDMYVRIYLGLQNSIRNSHDSDPKFLLSDGKRGIGFELRDDSPWCQGIQGTMGDTLGSRSTRGGSSHSSPILPEEYVLTLAPTQSWGTCFYAADNGRITVVTYSQTLHPEEGLWLEVYREDSSENYVINYIYVEIHEN